MPTRAVFFLDETDTYNGPEPYFYDKHDYAWARQLEDNWAVIRDEMMPFITNEKEIELSSPYPPPHYQNPVYGKTFTFSILCGNTMVIAKSFLKHMRCLKAYLT